MSVVCVCIFIPVLRNSVSIDLHILQRSRTNEDQKHEAYCQKDLRSTGAVQLCANTC
jgi:hypothetical protein